MVDLGNRWNLVWNKTAEDENTMASQRGLALAGHEYEAHWNEMDRKPTKEMETELKFDHDSWQPTSSFTK